MYGFLVSGNTSLNGVSGVTSMAAELVDFVGFGGRRWQEELRPGIATVVC